MIQTIISWTIFGATVGVMLLLMIGLLRKRALPWQKALLFLGVIQFVGMLIFATWYYYKLQQDQFQRLLLRSGASFYWLEVMTAFRPLIAGWLAAGGLFAGLVWVFIRRTGERLLDRTDVMLLTISAAAVGWPAVFILLAITFAFTVVGMLVMVALRRRTLADRLIVTPFILPAAIVTLVLEPWLLNLTGLIKIRF